MEFFNWLQDSLWLTLLFVFLVAFGESLALVGMIVPGAVLMLMFGALIGTGILPFWPTTVAAFLGAVLGDGLSYWLGARYHQRLSNIWPLSRYPDLLPQGQAFFHRHGGKSVFLGRFFGPVRAVIPAIAGMMHMPRLRFFFINITSALLWAPAYLLPGILFGASMELASEFAGRFTFLLITLFAALLLLAWLTRTIYNMITPHADSMMQRLINWSRRHPVVGEIPAALLSPEHKEIRGLSILALLLLLTTVGFILVSQLSAYLPLIQNINNLVFQNLQDLRSPPFDTLMIMITSLGDVVMLTLVVLITASGLIINKNKLALWHWLAAGIFPAIMVEVLKRYYAMPRPPLLDTMIGYAYPSGHATLSASIYGFLSILLVVKTAAKWHAVIYSFTTVLVGLIGFSRLYLGAHWLTDVIGGIFLGVAWTTLLGIAYRRHIDTSLNQHSKWRYWPIAILLMLMLYPVLLLPHNREVYRTETQFYVMSEKAWRESGWQVLPARRHDIRNYNDFPFTIQWQGTIAAIDKALQGKNWQPVDNPLSSYFNWINPKAKKHKLPIPTHVHDGNYDQYRWIYESADGELFVLRVWQARHFIENHAQDIPLWYGYVSHLNKSEYLGLSFLQTDHDFNQPLEMLSAQLQDCLLTTKQRTSNSDLGERVVLIEGCR